MREDSWRKCVFKYIEKLSEEVRDEQNKNMRDVNILMRKWIH